MTVIERPSTVKRRISRTIKPKVLARQPQFLDADLLGLSATGESGLQQAVEQGFSYRQWESLQEQTKLSTAQLANLVGMTVKTVGRRKAAGKLDLDESDRLLRISRVLARAIELFEGDRDAALTWLSSPARAFNERTPLSMVRTEVGAREVERLVWQLEHGVYP